MMRSIDLDQNATTPLDPAVLEAMSPYWLAGGNPESRHTLGRAARRGLEKARETVAKTLGASPIEVIFTSGGTEANNIALFGVLGDDVKDAHIITSAIEHPAVAGPLKRLGERGATVDVIGVNHEGLVSPSDFAAAIRPETRLITLMLANNEMGAIQPVAEVVKLAEARGIPVHTDAIQAVSRIPVNFESLGVTTLAASAHKFHGPAGVGVLLVRSGTRVSPAYVGGGQQRGIRPGTQTVALAVGLATALERWHGDREVRIARWRALRDHLEASLIASFGSDRVIRNGPRDESLRLPQTLNLGFEGRDSDSLLIQLDTAGVSISLGSACASGSTTPSATLVAMGVPVSRIKSSVRFSLGAFTTEAEIDEAIERIKKALLGS